METSRKQTTDIQAKIIRELEAAPDVRSRFWTDDEEALMQKYYLRKGPKALSKALNRSRDCVIKKAHAMGLKFFEI